VLCFCLCGAARTTHAQTSDRMCVSDDGGGGGRTSATHAVRRWLYESLFYYTRTGAGGLVPRGRHWSDVCLSSARRGAASASWRTPPCSPDRRGYSTFGRRR
jgi:hypothetical protein